MGIQCRRNIHTKLMAWKQIFAESADVCMTGLSLIISPSPGMLSLRPGQWSADGGCNIYLGWGEADGAAAPLTISCWVWASSVITWVSADWGMCHCEWCAVTLCSVVLSADIGDQMEDTRALLRRSVSSTNNKHSYYFMVSQRKEKYSPLFVVNGVIFRFISVGVIS